MNEIKYINNYFDKELYCINKDGTIIEDFIKDNNLKTLNVIYENKNLKNGDLVIVENCNYIIHIVLPGETLDSIAQKYNTTIDDIINKNKIKNIFIGQQVIIRL